MRTSAAALAAAAVAMAAPPAAGQPCEIYSEPFDSFLGPADLDDGTYVVRWCASGAAVSTSNFCPTGNAFKLDAATDDPLLWVDPGDGGCTEVTLRFDYSQFAATGTVLRASVTADTSLNCAESVPAAAVALDVTGGVCTPVIHTVAVGPGESVYWRFDHGTPGTNSIYLDSVTVAVTTCCGGADHDCCETGAAGCADPAVQACVCDADPFCCATEWDAQCVAEVERLGCGSCQPKPPPCATALAADFGAIFTPGSVCALFPGVFESCEGAPPSLTSATACGGPGDMVMRFSGGFPYSAAVTGCLDLAATTAPALHFSYAKDLGTLGPRVELSLDDGPFQTIWSAPISPGGVCLDEVLDLSAWAGESNVRLKLASGSSVANGSAFDDLLLVLDEAPVADCCTPGPAGCGDEAIEACVCAIDPFCCATAWDDICVLSVEFYGCGDCGFCVDALAADLGPAALGGTVCEVFPESFVVCEGAGPTLTVSGDCAGTADAALTFGASDPASAAVLRCLDLAAVTEAALSFTYTKDAGVPGPKLEASGDAGQSYVTLWTAPAAPGPGCHEACVDLAPAVGLPFVVLRLSAGTTSPGAMTVDDVLLLTGAACPVPGDVTGDGVVDGDDLVAVILSWGPCPAGCAADLNGDGVVGGEDLVEVLLNWG